MLGSEFAANVKFSFYVGKRRIRWAGDSLPEAIVPEQNAKAEAIISGD